MPLFISALNILDHISHQDRSIVQITLYRFYSISHYISIFFVIFVLHSATIITNDEKISNPYLVRAAEREEPMDFICGPKHALANKKRISVKELCEHPFVVTETGVSYTQVLEKFLAKNDATIEPFLEIGSTNVVIDMVKRNKAVAFLPHYIVKDDLDADRLVKLNIAGGKIKLYDQAYYHKSKWITPQMQEFLDLLCKYEGYDNLLTLRSEV